MSGEAGPSRRNRGSTGSALSEQDPGIHYRRKNWKSTMKDFIGEGPVQME